MKRILLADDDTDDAELFNEAMQSVDPDVVCDIVSDGADVLATLSNAQIPTPDMIILDINMPNVNGWRALKAIRSEQKFVAIPVFIYSTSSSDRDKEIAKDLGANGFYTKPERFEEVKKLASYILNEVFTHNF